MTLQIGSLSFTVLRQLVSGPVNSTTTIEVHLKNVSNHPVTGFRSCVSCDGGMRYVGDRALSVERFDPASSTVLSLVFLLLKGGPATISLSLATWFDPSAGGFVNGSPAWNVQVEASSPKPVTSEPALIAGLRFRVFLSYNRADSSYGVTYLHRLLTEAYGDEAVITDQFSIPIGGNFARFLEKVISGCTVVLAVIGPQWLQKIGLAESWTRMEIECALHFGVDVVPLLIEGATMPDSRDLPASLQPLPFCNGLPVRSGRDFDHDVSHLLEELDKKFPAAKCARRNSHRSL